MNSRRLPHCRKQGSRPRQSVPPPASARTADALEGAGCTNADILAHLRGPGPQWRGCFVVDALLGKT
jgi:hypothetical protein